ncbi:MAG: LLM class flavin-dependent oxidoreductase [Microbacterium sp.]
MTRISLGIAGAVGPDAAAALAPRLELAGFRSLWINETPGANALEVAAAAARETDRLRVATGVIPVDRRSPDELLDDIRRLELPEARLTLGIGAGQTRRGALARVEEAASALRSGTSARIAIGALGPRMRALAASASDGAVLSWLTPETAAAQAGELHAANPSTEAILYARANVDPAARDRLERETARYAELPAYAAHFARLGIDPLDTVLPAAGEPVIAPRIRAYAEAVDEIVLRAITPSDALEEYLEFAPLAG